MPTIKGSLNLVTDRPVDSISEVWVRARETRGQGDGLTVGINDRVPVSDGAVEFTALPGAAVLVLVQNGIPVETLPMLVGAEAQQSLRLVVQAGQVAGSADKSVIEQLAAEIAASVTLAEQYRTEAASSASKAKTSETAASKSATNAKTSETRAKTSETNAKTSETNAANSAASAESQQKSAWAHFNNTVSEAGKAASSAAAAKTSETNAASSASASASSASSASTQASKAATSATQAGSARDAAKASETAAAGSAAAAKTSETNAAQSSSSANTHRAAAAEQATAASQSATQSAAARDAAQQSQSAAKTSETNANAHRQAAATSQSNAATHETNAGKSATAAAGSATEAKGHADRAEQMADPTGLRNEVMQQLADLVDGAPEDLNTIREVAEYAQSNRGITDQLNAAIGGKADKSHPHVSADITDATDSATADRVVKRSRTGDFSVNEPTYDSHPANKGYVDALKDNFDGQGASIIPFNSVTGRQRWADGLTETIDAEAPTGRYYSNGRGWSQGRNYFFEVDPGVKYYASMWVKADKPGSRIYIEMRDQNDIPAILGNGVYGRHFLLGNYELPTEWTLLETQDMEFKPGVHRARINTLFFNHSNGTERDAVQMLTDIQLIPIPKLNSGDITGTDHYADADVPRGTVLSAGYDGYIHSRTNPTDSNHLSRKGYVDQEVAKKADKSHTHTTAQVDGLDAALDRLSNIRAWFRGEGPPPASIPGAQVGDWWLDTSAMELHEITGV